MNEDSRTATGMAAANLAAQKAREAVAAASRRLDEAHAEARAGAAASSAVAEDARQHLERLQQQARERASGYIRRNPLRAAGLAFAAGYLIAVLRRL
ncbi:MAG: hypothetical protein ACNA7W_14590 [Pseudomonadales bacterium]